jgi:short-subunit dehydrogenase
VVVITGASSGIGRAAARQFAREGARLALAARREEPLRAVAEECGRVGVAALPIPTDVRSEEAVRELTRRAAEEFGRIDVWVNCAGVMAYGRFEDVPAEVFRAVIETNFFGQVHAARAVMPHFRRQHSGVLINLNSVWGRITTPHVSAYVASKFALRGFSECLRHELRDADGIDVALILPHAVDTPIFGRSANYSGRSVRPIPPVLEPETVAAGIVRCARAPKREVTYRYTARALEALHAFLPPVYHRLLPSAFEAGTFRSEPTAPTPGTVLDAVAVDYAVEGGWKRERRRELAGAFLATARGIVRGAIGGHRRSPV